MLTVSDNHIVLGGGGGGGSTTFAGLSDKTTADIPATNTPTATALNARELSSNKQTDVDANKTSNIFYPTVKAVFDWVSGLFVKGAASSTDNAIARFDGATGRQLQNSNVTISDDGVITALNGLLQFHGRTPILNGSLHSGDWAGKEAYPNVITDLNVLKDAGVWNLVNTGEVSNMPFNYIGWAYVINLRHANLADAGNWTTQFFVTMTAVNTIIYVRQLYSGGWLEWLIVFMSGGALVDGLGSGGTNGQVLKNVNGLPVWSNP